MVIKPLHPLESEFMKKTNLCAFDCAAQWEKVDVAIPVEVPLEPQEDQQELPSEP